MNSSINLDNNNNSNEKSESKQANEESQANGGNWAGQTSNLHPQKFAWSMGSLAPTPLKNSGNLGGSLIVKSRQPVEKTEKDRKKKKKGCRYQLMI